MRSRPVDSNRHDGNAGLVGDEPGAVVDLHQASGAGDAPLGEDHQRLPAAHGVDQRPRGQRLRGIDRQRLGELEEGLDPPARRDGGVDGEDRLLVEQRQGEAGVEQADVVQRDDGVRPRLGEIVEPRHVHPVEAAQDHRQEVAEAAGRQGAEDPPGREEVRQAQHAEELGCGQAGELQGEGGERARHHEAGRQDVDGPDVARPVLGGAPHLDGGEDRHDEQPARDGDHEQVDRGVQAVAPRQQVLRAEGAVGEEVARAPAEVEREQPEQHRRDGRSAAG